MMDDGRELPNFDNHYSNSTLIDTWREDRWCHDSTGARLPFTLSGINAKQQEIENQKWSKIPSTYQEAFDTGPWSSPTPMTRPHGLGKELLLGTGEDLDFHGIPTSWDYGSHYPKPEDAVSLPFLSTQQTAGDPPMTSQEKRRIELLLAATATARRENGVDNLYESNHPPREAVLPKTFRDTTGRAKELPTPPTELPDYRRWDKHITNRRAGDLPVEHFAFQNQLPQPTV